MFDPKQKLAEARGNIDHFTGLVAEAKDRDEREFYQRMVALYTKVVQELESLY